MNCSIQLSSIHSPLVASYITLTLTDSNYRVLFPIVQRRQASPFLRRRMLYPAELCRHTIFGLLRWRSVTRQSPKSCINAGFVARCLRAKSRFFSLFDHPDRWPIFSIFSRYFFRRKCYLRPLQHLAFLIKILSTELPSTPEYFSIVLSTGPPLGGACFIR